MLGKVSPDGLLVATPKFAKVIRYSELLWGERLCDVIEKLLHVEIGKLQFLTFPSFRL